MHMHVAKAALVLALALLLALPGCLTVTPAGPTTWYVATTGNDGASCTQAQTAGTPKRTIGAALACIGTAPGAGAGHTVSVGPGTYAETIRNTLPSGTSWTAPFTLRANGAGVILKATAESNIFLAGIGTPALYAIVEGFILDGTNLSSDQIKLNGPRFVRFTNLEIVNTSNWSGIYTGYSTNLEILNNRIHDGTFLPAGLGHAMYIEGSDNLIEGNTLYNLAAFGVHIYSTGNTPSNNIVRNNVVHDFSLNRASASGILLSSGSNNQAYGNVVYRGRGTANNGGIGISASGTSPVVFNNTVADNTWIGIDTNGATGAVLTNNIVYGNPIPLNDTGSKTIGTNNLTIDPKFTDASRGDYTLQAGSPAIDAGTATITGAIQVPPAAVSGSAPDIGAHEYGGGGGGGTLPPTGPCTDGTVSFPSGANRTKRPTLAMIDAVTDEMNKAGWRQIGLVLSGSNNVLISFRCGDPS